MKYIIVHTNCDCCSDKYPRLLSDIDHLQQGPRCNECHKILGGMQWQTFPDEVFDAKNVQDAWEQYQKFLKEKYETTKI